MKTKTRHNYLLLIILLFPLSACQSGGNRSPVVTPQKMTCVGNIPAEITLYSPEEAVLNFEEKNYDLNRIETASGVKYGNRSVTYWNKGIDALITRDDGTMTTCTYTPKQGL